MGGRYCCKKFRICNSWNLSRMQVISGLSNFFPITVYTFMQSHHTWPSYFIQTFRTNIVAITIGTYHIYLLYFDVNFYLCLLYYYPLQSIPIVITTVHIFYTNIYSSFCWSCFIIWNETNGFCVVSIQAVTLTLCTMWYKTNQLLFFVKKRHNEPNQWGSLIGKICQFFFYT